MTAPSIHLRDVLDSDLPTLYEQQADPDAYLMADIPTRDRLTFNEHWARIRADPNVLLKTIVHEKNVAGYLLCWSREPGMPEVGYWLGRNYWGQGIASRGLVLFLDYVLERPLYARVSPDNAASQRVLTKAGFHVIDTNPEDVLFRLDAS